MRAVTVSQKFCHCLKIRHQLQQGSFTSHHSQTSDRSPMFPCVCLTLQSWDLLVSLSQSWYLLISLDFFDVSDCLRGPSVATHRMHAIEVPAPRIRLLTLIGESNPGLKASGLTRNLHASHSKSGRTIRANVLRGPQ